MQAIKNGKVSKVLSEKMVLARCRGEKIETIKKLNLWGQGICDVEIVRNMPQLEVISLSGNSISSLEALSHCPNLRELYLRNNKLVDLAEVAFLTESRDLEKLWLSDNPCTEGCSTSYRGTVVVTLPQLTYLDNQEITEEERASAQATCTKLEKPSYPTRSSLPPRNDAVEMSPPEDSGEEEVSCSIATQDDDDESGGPSRIAGLSYSCSDDSPSASVTLAEDSSLNCSEGTSSMTVQGSSASLSSLTAASTEPPAAGDNTDSSMSVCGAANASDAASGGSQLVQEAWGVSANNMIELPLHVDRNQNAGSADAAQASPSTILDGGDDATNNDAESLISAFDISSPTDPGTISSLGDRELILVTPAASDSFAEKLKDSANRPQVSQPIKKDPLMLQAKVNLTELKQLEQSQSVTLSTSPMSPSTSSYEAEVYTACMHLIRVLDQQSLEMVGQEIVRRLKTDFGVKMD